MKRVWTFLLVVLCSLNMVVNVHAVEIEKTYIDVSEHLIREGGRADLSTSETAELLDRVPTSTPMLFSMRSTAEELTIEEYLVQELSQFSETIDVSMYGISSFEEMGDIYWATLNEHPELFYVEGSVRIGYDAAGNIYGISPTYGTYTQEEIDAVYAAIEKPLQMLSDDMTEVEKILFLHDYLCVNVEYSEEDLESARYHSIEGVALEGMAVCEGYADSFQYFMNELDIPCNIVTNENHAWNQVQIDGEWYMLDATHDDPVHDQYGRAMHTYFLKSAALMDNRTWVESDFEICDSTRFDDAFWNNTAAQNIYQNGNWYYINESDMNLYCHEYGVDSISDPGDVVLEFGERWPVFDGGGNWVGSYSKLEKAEDKLIYSTPSDIVACDFDGTNQVSLATADTSKGYIYGMRLKNRQIIYQVAQAPDELAVEETTFDLVGMKAITGADIRLSEDAFYYTGEEQYPEITVELDGEVLEQDRDYSIDYDYPASGIGEVSVSITGIGYYKGTLDKAYEIKKIIQKIVCSKDNYEVEYGNASFNLNASVEGKVLQYTSSDEMVVTVDSDGTVAIAGIGTATITITAPGTEYYESDDKTIGIVVNRAQLPAVFTLDEKTYTYKGTAIEPVVNVEQLTAADYTITYVNNINAGNSEDENAPMVIVKGEGNYTGEIQLPFTIMPRELGEICDLPEIDELYYGQSLQSAMSVENDGSVYVDGTVTVEGSFAFVDSAQIPDAGTKEYKVLFTPTDSRNYIPKEFQVEVTTIPYGTAPNAPESNVEVEYIVAKLSDVTLPAGWGWKEDCLLLVGESVQCTAVYTGNDKGNYEVTEVNVTVTRLSCQHTSCLNTTTKASCTEDGKEIIVCNDCQMTISERILPKQGHLWDDGKITLEATAVSEGEKIYTCVNCGEKKTEVIPVNPESSEKPKNPEGSENSEDPENSDKPEDTENSGNSEKIDIPIKNTILKDEAGTAQYVVTKAGATGGTVTYKKNLKTKKSTVVIPGTIKIDGITYKVTAISKGAFKNNKMKKVTIPSGVTTIGDEAFSGCKKLTSVTIPSKVKKIGKKAFYKCSKLKSITIKTKKLKKNSIGSKAFKGIHKKATIKVPKKCFHNYKKWLNKAGVGSKATIKKQ